MPVWPGVGRADDHRLLEALRRGGGTDAQAPAALYDAYADRLSDYAYALLGDLDAAARAVHDALVAASCSAGRLTEPTRLRAWLYALTRFHSATQRGATQRGATRRETARDGEDGTGPVITVEESADPPLAALVREALGELGNHEREALELALRHGLTAAEIASVLGLASRQVSARLTRARDHLENAAAALVLARAGRAHCPELSALVDHGVGASWQDGPLAAPLRKRLSRHIAGCEICREGRGRHVSAGRLLDMIPVAFPPLSLRRRVIESALRADPHDGATALLDRRGFPAAAQPAARARRGRARSRPLRTAPVMLAAVCVFGTAGGLALVSGQAPAEHLEAIRMPPTAAPGDPTPGDPAPGDLVLGPEESDPPLDPPLDQATPTPADDTPTPQDDPPQSAATAPSHTTAPSGRSRPTPTRTPRAPRPALTALCPGDLGTAAGTSVTLAARDAVIEWTASTSGGIAVSPRHGRLRAGASGRVVLAVVDPGVAGTGVVTFQSSAGRPSCRVTWDGQEGTGEADPVPDPTSGSGSGPTAEPPGRSDGSPPPAVDTAASPSP
ncbi:sigma factor-like helix-turn-helix DNA-binding protein [Microbispora sp. H10836]|uniref:sigma factor-like helix-turn-helix DNA-binding protein n=1 Tax=Microbispora sp. H10836 TaxID=2729106 RepID=UPI0014739DD3|nr:sigma factor-like helix-turn-helix DNA-binding protein [Microbispora sp. H10836]